MHAPENEMMTQVGLAAGHIFRYLESRNEAADIESMRRELSQFDERTIHHGVGWLMREGKLVMQKQKSGNSFSYTLRLTR